MVVDGEGKVGFGKVGVYIFESVFVIFYLNIVCIVGLGSKGLDMIDVVGWVINSNNNIGGVGYWGGIFFGI